MRKTKRKRKERAKRRVKSFTFSDAEPPIPEETQ